MHPNNWDYIAKLKMVTRAIKIMGLIAF